MVQIVQIIQIIQIIQTIQIIQRSYISHISHRPYRSYRSYRSSVRGACSAASLGDTAAEYNSCCCSHIYSSLQCSPWSQDRGPQCFWSGRLPQEEKTNRVHGLVQPRRNGLESTHPTPRYLREHLFVRLCTRWAHHRFSLYDLDFSRQTCSRSGMVYHVGGGIRTICMIYTVGHVSLGWACTTCMQN